MKTLKKVATFLVVSVLILNCLPILSFAEDTTTRDDTPYIQNLIDAAIEKGEGEITIPSVNPADGTSVYKIGTSIVLSSNITVYVDNCTLRLNDGVLCNIFMSEGLYNSEKPTIEDEIKNVKIIGIGNAILDGGVHNGVTESTATKTEGYSSVRKNSSIFFRNVNGFEISNLTIKEPRYWGITFEFCRNGKITDIVFNCSNKAPNQDGIDLRCGCNNIEIDNISGVTGDDTVALTTLSSSKPTFFSVEGKDYDIHDVSITNVKAYCRGGHGIIRLLAHHGNQIYNVDMKNIEDTSPSIHAYGAIRIGDTAYTSGGTAAKYGDIRDVTIDNVISNAKYAIYIGARTNVTSAHVKYSNVTIKYGEVTNMLVENIVPLEYLDGDKAYELKRTDKTEATGTWNDNTSRAMISSNGTFNDSAAAVCVWPLTPGAISNSAALQVITPRFKANTDGRCSVRAQIIAYEYTDDPTLENLAILYSTDGGTTFNEAKVTKYDVGRLWKDSAGTAYPSYSFITEDLSALTNQAITNIMIKPYGENGSLTKGAFRLISISVNVKKHSTQSVPASAANCEKEGNLAHFVCTECGEMFLDEGASRPVSKENVILEKTGHSYVSTVIPSTETSMGYTEHVCSVCSDSYRDNYTGVIEKISGVKATASDVDITISWDGRDDVSVYYVRIMNADESVITTKAITNGATNYVFSGLDFDTEYKFKVYAKLKNGTFLKATDADVVSAHLVLGDRVVGIKSSVKGRTITVSWMAFPGADRYYVMVYPKGADPTVNANRVTTVNAGNNTAANIINVIAPETDYEIYVSARVNGKYQSLENALYTSAIIPVTAPSSFEVTSIEPTIVRIKWNAVKNADRYWARLVDENGATVKTRECAKALVSFTGLTPGKTYYVQLQARVPKSSGGNQYSGYCDPIMTQPITLPLK